MTLTFLFDCDVLYFAQVFQVIGKVLQTGILEYSHINFHELVVLAHRIYKPAKVKQKYH